MHDRVSFNLHGEKVRIGEAFTLRVNPPQDTKISYENSNRAFLLQFEERGS